MSYDGTLKFDTKIDSSGFQKGISKISNIAQTGLAAATAALGVVSTAISAIGTFSVKAGGDFEASMSNVAAIAGLTSKEAGSDYDILVKKAKEVASQSKFTAAETADALSYMAMAGWKTEDMTAALSSVVNLAAASGQDLASTSDILTDAITALGHTASDSTGIVDEFGNEVSYATHFADILAAASSNANTNVGMLGESFKYAAPVAGALGITAEDTSIALGLMANAGIKASQGGTALRTGLSNLVKPTKQMQTYMDKYNIALVKNADGSVNLRDTMESLREKMGSLSTTEQAAAASAIFGKEAMSGWLAIINASDADFEKLTNAIDNCDGTTQQMADTMNDNLKGQLTMLQSQLDILGVSIYESLQVPMKGAVQTLREFADELQKAYDEGGMDALIGKSGEVLAGMVTELAQAAPQVVEVALSVARSFISSLLANKAEVASAGSELVTTLITGIISFSGDLWSCAVELFAEFLKGIADNTPQIVKAAQDAIIQLGTALEENAPSIASSAVQIISALAKGFMQVLPQLIDIGKQIIEGIIQGVSEESPQLGAFLSGMFEGVQEVLGPAVDALKTAFEAVSSALSSIDPATAYQIGKAIAKVVAAFIAFKAVRTITGVVSTIGGSLTGLAGNVTSFAKKAVEGFELWSGGAGTLSEVLALEFPKIGAIVGKIGGLFGSGGLISTIGSSLSGVASAAATGIAGIGTTIMTGFSAVVAAIGAGPLIAIAAAIAAIIAVVCNWDEVKTFFTETLPNWWNETAWPAITGFFEAAGQWLSELPGKVVAIFTGIIESLGEWVASVGEWIAENVPMLIEAIVTFFSELPYKIGYAIGFCIGTFVSWCADVINWIVENVPLIIDSICTFFKELPGKVWDFLKETWDNLVTWGSDMLESAGKAAEDTINAVVEFFTELPGKLWEWLSQTYEKVVKWGEDTLDSAKKAAEDIITAVVDFFKELPGNVWEWLTETVSKVTEFGADLLETGRQAAQDFFDGFINILTDLPGRMYDIGSDIVTGVWDGIKDMGDWLWGNVTGFFSGLVDGVADGLEIGSPSKVFAREVGRWIPPGVGKGVETAMPDLISDTQDQMEEYAKKMTDTVNKETFKVKFDSGTSETYRAGRDNEGAFVHRDAEVSISGEIHTHVEIDKEEIGNATTPIVDRNFARIDQHKKRGG